MSENRAAPDAQEVLDSEFAYGMPVLSRAHLSDLVLVRQVFDHTARAPGRLARTPTRAGSRPR